MVFLNDLYIIYIAKEKSDMPTTTETSLQTVTIQSSGTIFQTSSTQTRKDTFLSTPTESSEVILKQTSTQSGFFQSHTTGCEAILKPNSGILLSIPLIVGVFN